ncbi:MAG: hypothetical protein IJI71_03880 [Clostridia bacterium]|nr:hypothetical protein [Clostridia bacterium]
MAVAAMERRRDFRDALLPLATNDFARLTLLASNVQKNTLRIKFNADEKAFALAFNAAC